VNDAWMESRRRWVELLREIRKSEVSHRRLTLGIIAVFVWMTGLSVWRFGLTPEVLFPATMAVTSVLWWHMAKKGVERTDAELERESLWLQIDEREKI